MSGSDNSWLYSGAFVEDLYEAYLQDPGSVSAKWRERFDGIQASEPGVPADQPHGPIKSDFRASALQPSRPAVAAVPRAPDLNAKQVSILQLINSYRYLGHRRARLDPLEQYQRPPVPELEIEYHGLQDVDVDTEFNTGSLYGVERASLSEILRRVRAVYCQTIGAEYMHITNTEQKRWIQQRLETGCGVFGFSKERKQHILERLVAANGLEVYLHRKYVGQKRFSLEGGGSLIPLLDVLIERASYHQTKELVLGMAHRGRLNVLVNIFGKSTELLFAEFEDKVSSENGSGDVKYHLGFSSELSAAHGDVHAVLAFNPSHLEIINPVVEGSVRARQERRHDTMRNQVLPVLIHGDAAFAGQGVVMETLNLSETRGYTTGGTVHVIVNNQIGFTTSDPLDSRSTLYCTDVAKMVHAPIFHVNGDDPEAVVFVTELALDFRMKFKKDVVIDMVCYRRHGHNEADEPSVTQPVMYQKIKDHAPVKDVYFQRLHEEGAVSEAEYIAMDESYLERLQANVVVSGPLATDVDRTHLVDFSPYLGTPWNAPSATAISRKRISRLAEKMIEIPDRIAPHRVIKRLMNARRAMGNGEQPMDWGFAETLAYAALLEDGYPVRLSGQDSARGTFAHRHAVVHDQNSRETYVPLRHLFDGQAQFLPINSLLSEEAVLGFEVGYSTAEPEALVIWEAQFGDFANGAQVIIDQFISSSEAKWQRFCGIVMLLPHGYDGQGPEHSSARLERYLQLCAEENIQVCVPSTPAQMFHMLRRQVVRPYRKPLIVMTPKSLLRHKLSVSTLEDISAGKFDTVIDEQDEIDTSAVTRLLLCSGKVYFELLEARRTNRLAHVAIVRIEQLYPFPLDDLQAVLERYPNAKDIVWVQEEPSNQGAWFYMQSRRHLPALLSPPHRLSYAGRKYSASPAVGYLHRHRVQQKALIDDALQLTEAEAAQSQALEVSSL
ncbi:MAG: 2-oxoglutarate dehydrogenase E1 component [Gammaproteobacteria bacterium]